MEREVYTRGHKPTFQHLEFMIDSMVPSHHRLINKWGVDNPDQKQLLRTGLSETGLQVTDKNEIRFLFLIPSIIFLVVLLILAALPQSTLGTGTYFFLLFGWIGLYAIYIVAFINYMKRVTFNTEGVLAYFTDWEHLTEVFADLGKIYTKTWKIADIRSMAIYRQNAPSPSKLIQKEYLSLEMQFQDGDKVINRQLFGSKEPVSIALHLAFYELALQKLGQVVGIKEDQLQIIEMDQDDSIIYINE